MVGPKSTRNTRNFQLFLLNELNHLGPRLVCAVGELHVADEEHVDRDEGGRDERQGEGEDGDGGARRRPLVGVDGAEVEDVHGRYDDLFGSQQSISKENFPNFAKI